MSTNYYDDFFISSGFKFDFDIASVQLSQKHVVINSETSGSSRDPKILVLIVVLQRPGVSD